MHFKIVKISKMLGDINSLGEREISTYLKIINKKCLFVYVIAVITVTRVSNNTWITWIDFSEICTLVFLCKALVEFVIVKIAWPF